MVTGDATVHVSMNNVRSKKTWHWKIFKFCKSVKGTNGIVDGWLIMGMTTKRSEDNTHSTRHAPYQGPMPNRPTALPPCHLRTRARPSVWCKLNLGSSVKIQCWQWRVPQTRYSLAHWQRRRRCTKVSLGQRVGLREWYPTARRHQVIIRTDRRRPVGRISWALNLRLEKSH